MQQITENKYLSMLHFDEENCKKIFVKSWISFRKEGSGKIFIRSPKWIWNSTTKTK